MNAINRLLRRAVPSLDESDKLREEALKLLHSMGSRPTIAQLEELQKITERLVDLGHWPSHIQMADIYRKLIGASLDWGQRDIRAVSPETRNAIQRYAGMGLMHFASGLEKGGKKVYEIYKREDLDKIQQVLQKYAEQSGILESTPKGIIQVPNPWGVGDGTPFVIEQHPNLQRIFSDPNPQPPHQITAQNRSYWDKQDQQTVRVALAMAYMSHPAPEVRTATIGFAKDIGGLGISQMLVNLLADSSPDVSTEAAKTIWEQERSANCKYAIEKLRDEMEGYETILGPTTAQQALNLLVKHAPDEQARRAITALING